MGNLAKESERLFNELINDSFDQKCLQSGVKDTFGKKFGQNWISVDLYDKRDFIDFNYDILDLKFEDESFNVVVCISILEHIPCPSIAIEELYRILKPGGKIWVQLAFQYPYHEGPKDYWRVSPDGLRIWMSKFSEIACGNFLWTRTSLVTSTIFFMGRNDPGSYCV